VPHDRDPLDNSATLRYKTEPPLDNPATLPYKSGVRGYQAFFIPLTSAPLIPPTLNMFTYTVLTLFAVLAQTVVGSPIEKRATNTVIRSGRNGQCLSIPGSVITNGIQLTTTDCKVATRWDISAGSGSVIVSGRPYALDAGVPQGNNNPAKIWQLYPGSTQQTWYLTADNRIAVAGGNQCLDQGDNGPQTYQCTSGNTNQGKSFLASCM